MKKHRKEKLAAGVVLAVLGLAGTASAFPTWMGVYGAYQTHDGANPGTYSILMNQDYWGLHAEVGIGIGGTWTTHAMEYAGNADGNSLWRFRPGEAVAEGASVQYYFHGWDDAGGHLYANNGGLNYSFVAGPAAISPGAGASLPSPRLPSTSTRPATKSWNFTQTPTIPNGTTASVLPGIGESAIPGTSRNFGRGAARYSALPFSERPTGRGGDSRKLGGGPASGPPRKPMP